MEFLGISWGIHNLLTCEGFKTAAANLGQINLDIGGPCSLAKLGAVLLFFVIAIIRKWGGEEIGLEFNMLWASIAGLVSYFVMATFTGVMNISFVVGLVFALIGGYGTGFIFSSEGGSDSYDSGSSSGGYD